MSFKQKNTLLLFLFVALFSSGIGHTFATATYLVISEIQISGDNTTDDFIEIYNPTSLDIGLDGYRLVKRTASGSSDTTIKSFSSSDIIPAYGYFLWANSGYTALSTTPDAATAQTIAADNGVALRQGAEDTGAIIDSVAWGNATNIFIEGSVFPNNPDAGQSLERKPGSLSATAGNGEDVGSNMDDFQIRTTPEPQNSLSVIEVPDGMPPPAPPPSPQSSDSIVINEIFPAPGTTTDWDGNGTAGVDDEWVELYNGDSVVVDLGSWTLDDLEGGGSTPYLIPSGTLIQPGGYLVFYKKDTNLVLNNTGDSVVLKKPDGSIRDSYVYNASPGTDQSIARNPDVTGSFAVAPFAPTPGDKNIGPNHPPIADAGNASLTGTLGQSFSFSASSSSDPDGDPLSFAWEFGTGDTGSGETVSYSFENVGTYTVLLTVSDGRGGSATDTISVVIGESGGGAGNPINNSSAVVVAPVGTNYNIKISAILPNPMGTDALLEYVELTNHGAATSLNGWSISDGKGKSYKIIDTGNIATGGKIKFFAEKTKISFNNSGDKAKLIDPAGRVADEVVFGSAQEGEIYALGPSGWYWSEIQEIEKKDLAPSKAVTAPKVQTSVPVGQSANVVALPLASVVSSEPGFSSDEPIFSETQEDSYFPYILDSVGEVAVVANEDAKDSNRSPLMRRVELGHGNQYTSSLPMASVALSGMILIFFVLQNMCGLDVVSYFKNILQSKNPVVSEDKKRAIEDLFK